jgi:putative ABC transport system ATP-binding protein
LERKELDNMIEIKNLTKVYGEGSAKVFALRNVNFNVEKGEILFVVGPSGSGKSTLLHLIGGLDTPTDGDVIFEGKSLKKLSDDELTIYRREKVGFVFQFFNLLPTLTAEENVGLPLLLAGKKLNEIQEKVDEVLNLVGLSERKKHRPEELSGGEQQRVAIARALITNPPLLLADEPTGNLDSKTGDEILKLLKKSVEEYHHTLILVTHNEKATIYAKRIISLRDSFVQDDKAV